jgi:hypothetical protein
VTLPVRLGPGPTALIGLGPPVEATTTWLQPEAPFPSWVWTEDHWEAPVAYPITNPTDDDPIYEWDEDRRRITVSTPRGSGVVPPLIGWCRFRRR